MPAPVFLRYRARDEAIVRRLLADYEALADKTDHYALRHLMAWCFVAAHSGNLEGLREAAQTLLDQAKGPAAALYISPMTVKRHVANLLGKLGVSRRFDAAERARALGILPER